MEPILIDVPDRIETDRLVLRVPRAGDGPTVNAAVCASLAELSPWMPWAAKAPTLDESELHARQSFAKFLLREDFVYLAFERNGGGSAGALVGGTGLHRIDWSVPRMEIGYWRRSGFEGRGYLTEAAQAMARLAFDTLGARRVEIRMDDQNTRSWRLAERAGFAYEGLLRLDSLTPGGEPRSTRIYARVRE